MSSPRVLKWGLLALLLAVNFTLMSNGAPADFKSSLSAHPTLGKLDFEDYEPVSGLLVHAQVNLDAPGLGDGDRLDAVSKDMQEMFAELTGNFERSFGPDWERHADLHIIVCQGLDEWKAARANDAPPSPGGADFVQGFGDSGAVVTYDFAFPGASRKTRLRGLLEATGQALLVAHAKGSGAQLPGAFLAGGGRLLAQQDPNAMFMRGEAEGKPTAHDRLVRELLEGGFQDGFLLDQTSLFAPAGVHAFWQAAKGRTVEVLDTELWGERRYDSLVDQAAFALAVGLASDQSGLQTSLTKALSSGQWDTAVMDDVMGAAWSVMLRTEHNFDPGFEPRGLGNASEFEAAVNGLNLPPAGNGQSSQAREPKDVLAEGLWLASNGRLGEAFTVLEEASSDPEVARNLAGITALLELRASYLVHLASGETKEKLRIDHEGRLLAADITRVGLQSVFLGENSRGVDSLTIASINVGELVTRMEKEKPRFGDSLGRGWAQALAGGKYKRSLDNTQKKDKVLLADLEAVESQLERGRVLNLISVVDLANTRSGQARLDAIANLLDTARDTSDVADARGHMEEVARAILAKRFANTDLMELLGTKSATRNGDRLTLKYDFKKSSEISDWPDLLQYSEGYVSQFADIDTKTASRSVKDGAMTVHGINMFQHVVSFKAPMKLTFSMSYKRTKKRSDAGKAENDFVLASICDDLDFQHIRMSQFGNLDIVDTETQINKTQVRGKPLSYKLGKSYKVELELDDKGMVTTRTDGKTVFTGDAGARKDGRVLFMIRSDRVVNIESITIEGGMATNQDALLEMWLTGQLNALGF